MYNKPFVLPEDSTHLKEALKYYALSRDTKIRTQVAKHGSTPPETLTHLCNDITVEVALNAAKNPNTTYEVFCSVWGSMSLAAALALLRNKVFTAEQYAHLYEIRRIPFENQRRYHSMPEKLALTHILGMTEQEAALVPLSWLILLYENVVKDKG